MRMKSEVCLSVSEECRVCVSDSGGRVNLERESCDVVWCGAAWCRVVQCGVVWYAMVCCGTV